MSLTAVRPTRGSNRTLTLEALRGLAALGVLATHAWVLDGTSLRGSEQGLRASIIVQGATGVWLFFVLSGYLISRPFIAALLDGAPLPSVKSYAVRRVARLYPAYLIVLAVFLSLIGGIVVSDAWQIPLHALLLQNLVPGQEHGLYSVSWTLSLEVLFYILVPVAAIAARRRLGPRAADPRFLMSVVGVTWITSIAWAVGAATLPLGTMGLWGRTVLPAILSMFCPGVLLAIAEHAARNDEGFAKQLRCLQNPRRAFPLAAILFVLGAIGTTPDRSIASPVSYEIARQAFALAFGLVAAVALRAKLTEHPWSKLAIWLGTISYGVYLWHGALWQILYWSGPWTGPQGPSIPAYLGRVAYLAALTIPLAWLSWRLVESPMIRRSQRAAPARELAKVG